MTLPLSSVSEKTPIVIDLDNDVRDANEFSDLGKLFQQEALNKIKRLIKRNLDNIAPDQQDEASSKASSMRRRHETITVHGQRGSGKTTFILNVLAALASDPRFCSELGVGTGQLISLDLIDPTLIETKEHVIVTLLTRIKREVDNAYRKSRDPAAGQEYKAWEASLEAMADGLALLDRIGGKDFYGDDWSDPHYVMGRGLERAEGGGNFERKLRNFIRISLEFLKAKAFVLAFDDIDTSFDRGWDVLEIIRKYLTTPQLITILSGDLELYSLLVRGRQWNNLGENLLKPEQWLFSNAKAEGSGDRFHSLMPRIAQTVEELEAQYLLKVLKPENRIDLSPLSFYIRADGRYDILVKSKRGEIEQQPLREVLNNFAAASLAYRSGTDQTLFLDMVLRQPTRTTIQLLQGMREAVDSAEREAKAKAAGGAGQTGERQKSDFSAESVAALRDSIFKTFSSSLISLGFPLDELHDSDPRRLILSIIDWLCINDGWTSDYRLRPEHRDDSRNLCVTAIAAALLSGFEDKPGTMLEYMLKVARTQTYISRSLEKSEEILDYIEFCGLKAVESPLQTVRKALAWERAGGRTATNEKGTGFQNLDRRLGGGVAAVPIRKLRDIKSPDEYSAALQTLYGLTYSKQSPFVKFELKRIEEIGNAIDNRFGIHHYLHAIIKKNNQFGNRNPVIKHRYINSVRSLAKNLHGSSAIISWIPLTIVIGNSGMKSGFYSITPILALISEMMSLGDQLSDQSREDQISAMIQRITMERSYHVPATRAAFQQDGAAETEQGDDDDEEEDDEKILISSTEDRESVGALVKLLADWRKSFTARKVAVAPSTLARAWTRFIFATGNIEEKLTYLESRYLGVLMHRYIVCFLNAILVEEATSKGLGSDLNLTNPITRSKPFLDNLSAMEGKLPPFFSALFSCPLWAYFLCPREEVFTKQKKTWETLIQLPDQKEKKEKSDDEIKASLAAELIEAGFSPGRSESSTVADLTFANLFDPLNSVYIQRNPEQAKPKALKLPTADSASAEATASQ